MASAYNPNASAKDFRVAIIGGGMCGLACAVGLSRFGIHADIFESAPRFDEVGAGVGLGPNALRALKGLGVLDAVLARGDDAERTARRMVFVSGQGAHGEVYDYNDSSEFTDADTGIGIYRPAFLDALLPLLPNPNATHFNKRCTSISTSTSGAQCIHFADGTTHEADLIIGADGIRSTSRNAVAGTDKKLLQFTNTVAYRGLVPMETLRREGVKTELSRRVYNFIGIDKHIIAFPIKSGKIVNIVAFATDNSVPVGSVEVNGPWVEPVPQQELLDRFSGWGHDVMAMLNHLKTPSKWSIHTLTPLETFVRGKIVLVGDAAHAMAPHLGAGVGQGFEDVFLLCELLGHPSTNLSNLEDILKAYDAVRQPRANMVLKESFRAGVLYEALGKPGYGPNDMEGHLAGIFEPIWRHDLDGDVASAIANLGSFPTVTNE
ncbi:FAD/NAD-P-binding domain-containing protein [Mycena alexandri]|uniref:FAD/NAD-P-binding domain-containing protein n=1 Tax=Mycena alexandri TaxID=1745969 RepID=A0AAD6TDI3_9AGAR|nr:FAD/NAD-P-binding domain-containing protein [Mycena alexandri]